MENGFNFDSNQINDTLARLYESGKFSYKQYNEQSKRLIEASKQMKMKEEETKQKLAEEETKQKLAEEETKRKLDDTRQKIAEEIAKQKTLEYETRQLVSNNNVKNSENISKAVIKWGDVLGPVISFIISLFDNSKIIQNQTNENSTNIR